MVPFNFLREWLPELSSSIDTQLEWTEGIVGGLRTLEGRFGTVHGGVRFRQVNPRDPGEPNDNLLESYGLPGAELVWRYQLGGGNRGSPVSGTILVRFVPAVRSGFEKLWPGGRAELTLTKQPRRSAEEIRLRILDRAWLNPAASRLLPSPQGDPREYLSAVEAAIERGRGTAGADAPALLQGVEAERVRLDIADVDDALRTCFPDTAMQLLAGFLPTGETAVPLDLARESVERALAQCHPDRAEEIFARIERAR